MINFNFLIQKFKLLQFQLYTGLTTDNEMEFSTSISTKQSKQKSLDIEEVQVLQLLSNVSKQTQVYSQLIARTMCKFMKLTYENKDVILQQLPSYIQLVYHDNGTSILLLKEHNLLILCFAGTKTQSLRDWWVNITGTYQKEWFKQKRDIIRVLKQYANDNTYTIVCGHSKGGIMSILAYNDNAINIDACYVAGVPDYFVTSQKTVGIYNIKHKRDPVSALLGSEKSNWEIVLGNDGPVSLDFHRIVKYIELLS